MFYINLPHVIQINIKLQHTSQKKPCKMQGLILFTVISLHHTAHATHTAHVRHCRFVFWDFSNHTFSRQH